MPNQSIATNGVDVKPKSLMPTGDAVADSIYGDMLHPHHHRRRLTDADIQAAFGSGALSTTICHPAEAINDDGCAHDAAVVDAGAWATGAFAAATHPAAETAPPPETGGGGGGVEVAVRAKILRRRKAALQAEIAGIDAELWSLAGGL